MRSEFRRGDLVAEIDVSLNIYTVVDRDNYSYVLHAFYDNCPHRFLINKVVAESDFVRVGREKPR